MQNTTIEVPLEEDDNPLDIAEELAQAKGWTFTRHDDDLMSMTVKGQKAAYEVTLEWQDEFAALLFSCSLPLDIAEEHAAIAVRALEQINENLWMGHFDLSDGGIHPTYRYTLLCRLLAPGTIWDAVYDVLDIAIAESNRFYTTFQLVQAGDVRLQDNLQAAVFETIGEA